MSSKTARISLAVVLTVLVQAAGLYATDAGGGSVKKSGYTQPAKAAQTYQYQNQVKKEVQIGTGGWVILGADVVMAGVSIYSLLDEQSAATSYDKLFADLNNTTKANYDMLAAKKKEIDSKVLLTGVSAGITGALAVYTLVDLFWLHIAFPEAPKVTYNPLNKSLKLSIDRRF